MSRAVIFTNGCVPDLESVRRLIKASDTLLAADGGTRRILALGLNPSVIIGDLDSLATDDKQQAIEQGTRLVEYSSDKNETDLELALEYTLQQGFREILIVGALGGRLDQTLGNLSLLADPRLSTLDVRLNDGIEEAFFMRHKSQVHGAPGDMVSLIPWGAPATGVTTDGLHWPLRRETLYAEKTRGISNKLLGETASVEITSGLVLVIHRRQSQTINYKS